tara:strand:+ start:6142 stop:6369 length:228 start_codon:yes stop_codon:yes gene_type:complete
MRKYIDIKKKVFNSLLKQHEYNNTNQRRVLTKILFITDLTGVNNGPRVEFNLEFKSLPKTSVGAQFIKIRAINKK